MQYHTLISLLLTTAITFVVAAVGKILIDPRTIALVEAFGAKLGAETDHAIAQADASNNALLVFATKAAMTYAENHEAEVLKTFNSKADFVISTIEVDPRFAHLNLPLASVKNLVEELFQSYFAALPHKSATAGSSAIPKPLP